ncbi:TIGR04104 family putative zinc finger protein [Virgibacillus ihumii]|uniref:TIGR04104 family putative zinc finger protein n=1 Tax=Virgibacillus ihumii TaxID=2686091 RepID=UPI00157CBCE8|nr:TIGR04104 family putative zinc finger protein [Virgibacillus ihumii]
MPTCQNCNYKWSWKQTFRKSFTLDTGMGCPCCGEKQYPTTDSKKRFGRWLFIPPFTILLSLLFDVPTPLVIGMIIVVSILLLCMYPYTVELSNQEEALW